MWETLRKEDVVQKLRTKQGVGLTQREVQVRKQKYGNNKLQEKKKETLIIKFIKHIMTFVQQQALSSQKLLKKKQVK